MDYHGLRRMILIDSNGIQKELLCFTGQQTHEQLTFAQFPKWVDDHNQLLSLIRRSNVLQGYAVVAKRHLHSLTSPFDKGREEKHWKAVFYI
jgi:hypothetical protein